MGLELEAMPMTLTGGVLSNHIQGDLFRQSVILKLQMNQTRLTDGEGLVIGEVDPI